MPLTRTPEEILARVEEILADDANDFFGFRREALFMFLPFDQAKPFLKEGTTADEWNNPPRDLDGETADYYQFALGKIEDHRGISAGRSVDKLRELAWLAGRDDVAEAMDAVDYVQYGAPKIKAFADTIGYTWPERQDLTNMANGNPCTPDCADGCRR
jgi:hypothetical protein